jgi:hypothetical protein
LKSDFESWFSGFGFSVLNRMGRSLKCFGSRLGIGFRVLALGLRVQSFRIESVSGLKIRVHGSGCHDLCLLVYDLWFLIYHG